MEPPRYSYSDDEVHEILREAEANERKAYYEGYADGSSDTEERMADHF